MYASHLLYFNSFQFVDQTETQYLSTHPPADQDYLHPLVHSQIVESDMPTELV